MILILKCDFVIGAVFNLAQCQNCVSNLAPCQNFVPVAVVVTGWKGEVIECLVPIVGSTTNTTTAPTDHSLVVCIQYLQLLVTICLSAIASVASHRASRQTKLFDPRQFA